MGRPHEALQKNGFPRLALLSLLLATGLLAACGPHQTAAQPQVRSGLVSIGAERDFPAGTVSTRFLDTYGIAIANDSGTVIAIRPVCPSSGDLAEWKEDQRQFVCPRDGSRFDLLGRVLKGPAKKPLAFVPTLRNPDGTLAVDLDRLYGMEIGLACLPRRA